LTKEQWIEKSREAKKARLQEKRNKQHSTSYAPTASTSDYRSYLSRAQECGDYFTSTLVHKNRECAILTVLDSGSDENVLTATVLPLLGITLPAGTDQPSVEMADGRVVNAAGFVNVRLANRLILRDVKCLVIENPEPLCLIGRPMMKSLGIDPQRDLN
jgi:hypothetical protein